MAGIKRNPVLEHPLVTLKELTVKMKWDSETKNWVTHVPELNNISTYGKTETEALNKTSELIVGYLDSMADVNLRVPLSAAAVRRVRAALS